MAVPTDRDEFIEYCKRKLGAPVIKINLDQTQMDDAVDEALKFWFDYSYDGQEKVFYKHLVDGTDVTNKYITLPENIQGAVRIFDISTLSSGVENPFNIQWQIAMNELYTIAGTSMIPYYTMRMHLDFIADILIGKKPIRYNRHTNKLYVDMDWDMMAGKYLLVEAYEVIDPETYQDAFGDRTLQNYATALIKLRWANVLKKYDGMEMPGGLKFNGQKMFEEAQEEIAQIEEFIMGGNLPSGMFIG